MKRKFRFAVRDLTDLLALTLMITIFSPTSSGAQNLLALPESIVFDEQNNRYLLSNYNTGDIVQIDENGHQSYFVRGVDAIQGLEIVGNAVYVGCGWGVRGFDLTTGETVMDVAVPGVVNLNDVTSDTSGNLYVTDVFGNAIVRVRISDQSYSTFATEGISSPNGILFDAENNRLLLCSYRQNSPIQAISLDDSTVSTVMTTSIDLCDGLTKDDFGNYYVTSWRTYAIYRIDASFSDPPEMMYSHSGGPADISYNRRDDILAIPLMNINSYDLVPISPTAVPREEEGTIPKEYLLSQNYPNPFNPSTTIAFTIFGKPGLLQCVRLDISDIRGRHVCALVDSGLAPGSHSVIWEGRNTRGERVPSGIYFYTLKCDRSTSTRKMVLME